VDACRLITELFPDMKQTVADHLLKKVGIQVKSGYYSKIIGISSGLYGIIPILLILRTLPQVAKTPEIDGSSSQVRTFFRTTFHFCNSLKNSFVISAGKRERQEAQWRLYGNDK
jgi:hypothetical protein